MNISFDYNEMKNFISHTGKYKIVNVKCFIQVPSNWYNQFRREEEEVDMEVAYLIDDIETEKFLLTYNKRESDLLQYTINCAFYKEMKNKLLNL
jgi:hypothetical protein